MESLINLLVFKYYKWWKNPEKLEFQVYSKEDKYICNSSFQCKNITSDVKENAHGLTITTAFTHF